MKHYLYPFSGDIIVDHCNYAQMEVLTANSPFIEVWGKKKRLWSDLPKPDSEHPKQKHLINQKKIVSSVDKAHSQI